MPTVRSSCPLDCPDACTLDVTVVDQRVTAVAGADVGDTGGFICSKVARMADHLYGPERLLHPLKRVGPKGSGAFERIGWDEALDTIAARFAEIRERHGGEALLPYSYGGSNGALTEGSFDARFFQRLGAMRLYRNFCALPSSAAATAVYGRMPGMPYAEFAEAELVLVWGCNPHATGIHLLPHLRAARKAGGQLIVVDPRRTKLARDADLHVAPHPGTDLPLALAVAHQLFERGYADETFLAAHATGVEAFRARAAQWPVDRAAKACRVPAVRIEELAERYGQASPAALRCGWGPERNRNGGSATAAILALPAVANKFGPVGGGYTLSNSGYWKALAPGAAAHAPPTTTRQVPMTSLGEVLTADHRVRGLFVYNSNPVATCPEQVRVRQGLAREDLFTVVFEQVHTDTCDWADIVLPATTFLEHREAHRGYGSYVFHDRPAAVAPAGEARPNAEVFATLTERLGFAEADDPDEDAVAATLRAQLGVDSGLHLADPGRPFQDFQPWTDDGKVHLDPGEGWFDFRPDPAPERLALISPALGRMVSSTFGQLLEGRQPVLVHPDDARTRGLVDGALARVHNELGEVVLPVRVSDETRPGTVVIAKGLWKRHTANGAASTALCAATLSDFGDGACYNDARVELTPA